jgi:hypothetical protein
MKAAVYRMLVIYCEPRGTEPMLMHCRIDGEYLGTFTEYPRSEGPLDEPRGPDGRRTLFRAILPNGRAFIVSGIGWEGGVYSPPPPPAPPPGPPQLALTLEDA